MYVMFFSGLFVYCLLLCLQFGLLVILSIYLYPVYNAILRSLTFMGAVYFVVT